MIPLRSSALLIPVAEATDCHIAGRCLTCRTIVAITLAHLPPGHAFATLGQVGMRLHCELCGTRPSGLMLIEAEGCAGAPLTRSPGHGYAASSPLGDGPFTLVARPVAGPAQAQSGRTGPAGPPALFRYAPQPT